jgi:hypothetical protein
MKRTALLLVIPLAVNAQTTINGGRIYKGTLDASGAASTLPYRTGTGSPAGRDNCGKPGESYFQTDAAGGQNVWGCTVAGTPGTWNQMTGGASVMTGAAAPGGSCPAGALYVRTDLQQFYVCSATNTWQLSSYGSNLLGNRPANCVAGQVFLATDTGTLSYCSVPGSPGTWQAVTGALASVFGRTGAVTAQAGDYTAAQVTNAAVVNAANTYAGGFLQNFGADDVLLPIHASDPATCTAGQLEFNSTSTNGKLCTATNTWTAISTGSGVMQLTGDVTAGPGSGPLPATVTKINGTTVPTSSAADQTIVTTASATAAWVTLANCAAAGGVLQYATATHGYSCHTLTAADIPAALGNTTSVNGSTIPAGTTLMTTSTALATAQEPAHSGDVTNPAGSLAMTLATVNGSPGSCGDATHVCQVTTNSKGLVTSQNAVSIDAGGNANLAQTTTAFSATPTFIRIANIMEFTITLTGNVTSSTLGGAVADDILIFNICQDATGGRGFTWPTGFASAASISYTAGVCTRQQFVWDGATANPSAPATSTDVPFLISGAIERAAPSLPPSGVASLWPDSTRHTWASLENNTANLHIMPRTAGSTDQLASTDLSDSSKLARGHAISISLGYPTNTSALTTSDVQYVTVPFACTISGYNLAVDAADSTFRIKWWKVATGTAIPASANSINTSGLGVPSGTAVHSTTLTDFTVTSVGANDIMAMAISTANTVKYVNGVLQCDN